MDKYRGKHNYLSAWSYVLLEILYAIPVLGWIFLIAHCFGNTNENRCHFARSYFARLLLIIVIVGICAALCFFIAGPDKLNELVKNITKFFQDNWNSVKNIGKPAGF